MTNLRLIQIVTFCKQHFKSDENGKLELRNGRKDWERRDCSLRAIFPFPTVFPKDLYYRRIKTRACWGKGLLLLEDKKLRLVKIISICRGQICGQLRNLLLNRKLPAFSPFS